MTAAEADRALTDVEIANRDALEAGLEVIRRWALEARPFSANDVREELRAVGVDGPKLPGAVWNAARQAGIVRKVGYETSRGDTRANGKPVARYLGAQHQTPLEVLTGWPR